VTDSQWRTIHACRMVWSQYSCSEFYTKYPQLCWLYKAFWKGETSSYKKLP